MTTFDVLLRSLVATSQLLVAALLAVAGFAIFSLSTPWLTGSLSIPNFVAGSNPSASWDRTIFRESTAHFFIELQSAVFLNDDSPLRIFTNIPACKRESRGQLQKDEAPLQLIPFNRLIGCPPPTSGEHRVCIAILMTDWFGFTRRQSICSNLFIISPKEPLP